MLYLTSLRDGQPFAAWMKKCIQMYWMSPAYFVLCHFLAIYFCKYEYKCLSVQAYSVLHPFCTNRKVGGIRLCVQKLMQLNAVHEL